MRDMQEQQLWGDNWVTRNVGVNRIFMLISAVFWLMCALVVGDFLSDVPLFWGFTLLSVVKGCVYFILIVAATDLIGNLGPVFARQKPGPSAAPLVLNILTILVILLGHAWILK